MSRWAKGTEGYVDHSPIPRNGYDRRVLMVTCSTCGAHGQPCVRMNSGKPTTQAINDAHPARYDEAERVYLERAARL